jgi:hypothetical protein
MADRTVYMTDEELQGAIADICGHVDKNEPSAARTIDGLVKSLAESGDAGRGSFMEALRVNA